MIRFNVCARKAYKAKDGTEKVAWLTVGTLMEVNSKKYLELNMMPGTQFFIFPTEEKGAAKETKVEPTVDDIMG
jgi:hypothetical protein